MRSSGSRATAAARIRRWLRAARKLGWEPGQGEPDEPLAAAVAKRVRPVPGRGRAGARARPGSLPHREQIRAWLEPEDEHRGLRLTKVQQLLARQGVDVPYSSLHRFAVQHCGFAGPAAADRAPGRVRRRASWPRSTSDDWVWCGIPRPGTAARRTTPSS